jgi:hypothetical protein
MKYNLFLFFFCCDLLFIFLLIVLCFRIVYIPFFPFLCRFSFVYLFICELSSPFLPPCAPTWSAAELCFRRLYTTLLSCLFIHSSLSTSFSVSFSSNLDFAASAAYLPTVQLVFLIPCLLSMMPLLMFSFPVVDDVRCRCCCCLPLHLIDFELTSRPHSF